MIISFYQKIVWDPKLLQGLWQIMNMLRYTLVLFWLILKNIKIKLFDKAWNGNFWEKNQSTCT